MVVFGKATAEVRILLYLGCFLYERGFIMSHLCGTIGTSLLSFTGTVNHSQTVTLSTSISS